MPLWTPPGPCFQGHVTNLSGRPASAAPGGVVITAGASNTKGAYTEILGGAAVTFDVYAIALAFSESNFSADNCEILLDLAFDPTNSSSFTVKIANLQVGHAGGYDGGHATSGATGGIPFTFPLFFPAGTQFAARAQTNDNTDKSVKVLLHLYGKPKYPHLARAGAYCDTFGANIAASTGVTITPGTASEGAWTDISGADTTKPYWFWEMGLSFADTGMTNNIVYGQDLGVGDGTNNHIVIEDQYYVTNDNECISKDQRRAMFNYYEVGPGVRPYIRSQCSGVSDANMNCCVYAVGG